MPLSFIMPIEWANCLAEDGDPEDCGFLEEEFSRWLRDNRDLEFAFSGERIETTNHVVEGYYEGEVLICREVVFNDNSPGSSSRRTVRRELRISVPTPTKLPLP